MGGMPSVGVFLRDSSPYLREFRRKPQDVKLSVLGPTNDCARKLVDGRCRVQFPLALVDLAVWSFSWFCSKLA